jgi:hypothetical protein
LKNLPHVIDVYIDLIFGVLPILIDRKGTFLKSVLEKELRLAVDVLEESGFCENTRAFDENPSFGRFFWKKGRTCTGPKRKAALRPCPCRNRG